MKPRSPWDLGEFERVESKLPQPLSMSLVDLQCWIINLFGLHPETQDLEIKAFFIKYIEDRYPVSEMILDWKCYDLITDAKWAFYVKKVRRSNGVPAFVLYVDCSEIRHYKRLLKAGYDAYSQVAMGANLPRKLTRVLPEEESLSCERHASRISNYLQKNPAMTTAEIVAHIAELYREQISLAGAWRAKQKALELQFGTFYESYDYAPRLLMDILSYRGNSGFYFERKGENSDHFVDIMDTKVDVWNVRVLHRIFWAFTQCIQGFVSCRPVLCVKSLPLCGKYHGVLLTALALDANDDYIPVAFAIVESESKECWLWFLRNLKRAVVKERSGVCIIHDYKRELLDAIEDLQSNQQGPHPWRDMRSRWCVHQLAEIFLAHFGDKKLMMLFKRLCQQNRQSKFVKIWKELDELTLKYMVDKAGTSTEMQHQSIEHDGVGNDSDDSNSNSNRRLLFSEWIRSKSMEKWSLLHDSMGARYSIMGVDMADLNNNHVLKGINCLPLAGVVKLTLQRMEECFNNRHTSAKKALANPSMQFPERVQDEINAKMQKSQRHQVIYMNTEDGNHSLGDADKTFEVQLRHKKMIVQLKSFYIHSTKKSKNRRTRKIAKCSCNKPQLYHKPCSHVISVCRQIGVSTDKYMSPYYSLAYLARTWDGSFDVSDSVLCRHYSWYKNLMQCMTPGFIWIPDKKLEYSLPTDCIQTGRDDNEQQQCITERK